MSQIGIPKYKDLINKVELKKVQDLVNAICIDYANLTNNEAVNNREDNSFEVYTKQFEVDLVRLKDMALRSQELVNKINDILYIISTRECLSKLYSEE